MEEVFYYWLRYSLNPNLSTTATAQSSQAKANKTYPSTRIEQTSDGIEVEVRPSGTIRFLANANNTDGTCNAAFGIIDQKPNPVGGEISFFSFGASRDARVWTKRTVNGKEFKGYDLARNIAAPTADPQLPPLDAKEKEEFDKWAGKGVIVLTAIILS